MGNVASVTSTKFDTTTNRDLLKLGLRKLFDTTQREAHVFYPKVVNDLTTKEYILRDQQMAGLDLPEAVHEGENVPIQAPVLGGSKTYTQDGLGTGFRITHMMDYFNKYNLAKRLTESLGVVMKEGKDIDVFLMFNNPTASTYGGTGFDSNVLAYATHTGLASGTGDNYDNYLDATLSFTAIADMRYYFATLEDDMGRYMGATPSILAYEPTQWVTVNELFGSTGKPYTGDNTTNVLKDIKLELFECPRLTSTTAWFVEAKKDKLFDINVFTSMKPQFWTKDAPDTTKDTIVFSLTYYDYGFGNSRHYLCGNT